MAAFFAVSILFHRLYEISQGDAQSLSARQVQSGYQNGQQRRASRMNPMHS